MTSLDEVANNIVGVVVANLLADWIYDSLTGSRRWGATGRYRICDRDILVEEYRRSCMEGGS